MQVHCVDLGESFQTHIFLQNLASIQPRTSLVKSARSPQAQIPQVRGQGPEADRHELRLPVPAGQRELRRGRKLDRRAVQSYACSNSKLERIFV